MRVLAYIVLLTAVFFSASYALKGHLSEMWSGLILLLCLLTLWRMSVWGYRAYRIHKEGSHG